MTLRDALQSAIRTCLIAGTGQSGAKIILADDPEGQRPDLPYLTVKLLAYNIVVGLDARVNAIVDGDPVVAALGSRYSTLEVQSFGTAAYGWLEELQDALTLPGFLDVCTAQKVVFSTLGKGIRDITTVLDTGPERRGGLDLQVDYRTLSTAQAAIELLTVQLATSYSLSPGGGATLSPTYTASL